MHYTKPAYYDKFKCTADRCPDTCCQGWQIIIDPESIRKYKANPILWNYVKDSIDWKASEEGPTYKLKNRTCTHLTSDGLCEMQMKYGFDALCQVCQKFPRHVEEFDGERELSIDLSCPEGARLVLEDEDGTFVCYDDDKEETDDYDDFDYFLYTELTDARETLFSMIADAEITRMEKTEPSSVGPSLSEEESIKPQPSTSDEGSKTPLYPSSTIEELMESMLSLGQIWQDYLDDDKVCEINEEHKLPGKASRFSLQEEKRLFSKLYDLEVLRPEWLDTVDRTYRTVFSSEESYRKACQKLEDYGTYVRRVLRYMIYLYFDGAVYDDGIYAKIAFSVYCVRWSFFVFFSDPEEKDDMQALIRAVYIFSREVEHSDLNISMLEDWL